MTYNEMIKINTVQRWSEVATGSLAVKLSPSTLHAWLHLDPEPRAECPPGWEQLSAAARELNQRRKLEAGERRAWCIKQAEEVLRQNPNIRSESRIAELIASRAKRTEYAGMRPRTIRRHIKGNLAKPSKHGQTR